MDAEGEQVAGQLVGRVHGREQFLVAVSGQVIDLGREPRIRRRERQPVTELEDVEPVRRQRPVELQDRLTRPGDSHAGQGSAWHGDRLSVEHQRPDRRRRHAGPEMKAWNGLTGAHDELDASGGIHDALVRVVVERHRDRADVDPEGVVEQACVGRLLGLELAPRGTGFHVRDAGESSLTGRRNSAPPPASRRRSGRGARAWIASSRYLRTPSSHCRKASSVSGPGVSCPLSSS